MKARDTFLQMWQREFETTCRVFKAFRADQLDVKPHEQSRSVRDLAWQCVSDERVIGMVVEGKNDLRNVPKGPALPETMEEILGEYESIHRDSYSKVSRLSEDEFDRTITFITFAGSGELQQPEVLWGNLMDQVHHRGQLTVYLRQAGGRVPSIYGPSGDEPR